MEDGQHAHARCLFPVVNTVRKSWNYCLPHITKYRSVHSRQESDAVQNRLNLISEFLAQTNPLSFVLIVGFVEFSPGLREKDNG
jgi:hypothetical protein